jgi:hypothetical protein
LTVTEAINTSPATIPDGRATTSDVAFDPPTTVVAAIHRW